VVVLLLPRKLVGEPLKLVQLQLEQLLEPKVRAGIRAKVEQLRLLTKMRKLGKLRLLIILTLSPARFWMELVVGSGRQ
jgi:hypothetical protein